MRAWICALLIACTGSDHHSTGPYVALDEIEAAYQVAICQHLATCHEMDQATCMTSNVGTYDIDPLLVSYALAGKLRYNGSKLADCFDALAASSCNPGDLANRRSVSQCALGVFSGALKSGEACTGNLECVSDVCAGSGGNNCVGDLECCSGTCVGDLPPTPALPPGLGDPCPLGDAGFDACVVGQYCDEFMAVCMAVKPLGQLCRSTAECADGLECDTQNTNSCAVPPLLGEPCPSGKACGEEGTYCEPVVDVCSPVGLPGDSCAAGHVCSKFLYCDSNLTCQLYPRTGESCEQLQHCNDLDTYCDIDTEQCTARLPNNATCDASYRCASGFCDVTSMKCAAQPLCPVSSQP